MVEKRRGLGRGLGALIPSDPDREPRPSDVFFPHAPDVVAHPPESGADAPYGTVLNSHDLSVADATRTQRADVQAPAQKNGRGDGHSNGRSNGHTNGHADVRTAELVRAETKGRAKAHVKGHEAEPDLVPVPGARFAEVAVVDIRPNPRQPRDTFDEEALVELVASIQEVGVLQPVVLRPLTPADDGVHYELIMGERRWRATIQAGHTTIPAIIRETADSDLLRDALLENLHRSDLNPLEEAAAYQQLLDDFGCTHDELARRIHRSRPQITNTLRLLRLPPQVQRRVAAGVLSAGHARALLGLPNAAAIERLAQRIVAEGLSVRATEESVALGGETEKRPVAHGPRPGERNGALDDLAGRLSDRFDTRVRVSLGKTKGRVTVEFASVQDLNRILEVIAPDDPGLLR